MGSYNCRECIERDINTLNEILINNRFFSSDTLHEAKCNSRNDLLKELKSNEKEDENENINLNNIDTDISIGKNALLKKLKNKKEINNNNIDNLKKGERENKILLKNELNKINIINDVDINSNLNNENSLQKEVISSLKNNPISNNYNHLEINKNIDENNNKDLENKINSEKISKEQKKMIEQQKEQILAQQKIIEQYRQQQLLYEQKKLEIEEAQLKIQLHNLQLQNIQEINAQKNQIKNQNKNSKIILREKPRHKKITSSKSSQKPKKNKNLFLNKQQIEFNKYNELQNNQLEEINNYEKVEDLEEVDEKMIRHYQSQKFKIETYEPIEQGNENPEYYENLEENKIKNQTLNKNKKNQEIKQSKSEPKDSLYFRKALIPKQNTKNNYYTIKKKKKNGPSDSSGKKKINNKENYKGKIEKNKELVQKMKIKEMGPRDSKRKVKPNIIEQNKEEKNVNNSGLEDQFEEEPINSNEDINYLKKHNIIPNPIPGAISKSVLRNNVYNSEIFINNQNSMNNRYTQNQYNLIKKEIIPLSEFDQFEQNNIYYSPQPQRISLKYNEILNSPMQQIYSEDNNNFDNHIYVNDNRGITTDNIIYDNNIELQRKSYNNDNLHNKKTSFAYEMTGSDYENPLLYSDNMGNMNYLEKQYEIYQGQMKYYNNDGSY